MSLTVDFPEFKRLSKEFFDALPSANPEEADAGFKCLTLAYMGMTGSEIEVHQAQYVVKIAARQMMEREFIEVVNLH